jgi:hypothetical protein
MNLKERKRKRKSSYRSLKFLRERKNTYNLYPLKAYGFNHKLFSCNYTHLIKNTKNTQSEKVFINKWRILLVELCHNLNIIDI